MLHGTTLQLWITGIDELIITTKSGYPAYLLIIYVCVIIPRRRIRWTSGTFFGTICRMERSLLTCQKARNCGSSILFFIAQQQTWYYAGGTMLSKKKWESSKVFLVTNYPRVWTMMWLLTQRICLCFLTFFLCLTHQAKSLILVRKVSIVFPLLWTWLSYTFGRLWLNSFIQKRSRIVVGFVEL